MLWNLICKTFQQIKERWFVNVLITLREVNPYNLYYTEDVITLSESFLKDTENAYNVDTDTIQILSPDGFRLYPNSSNSFLPSFDDSNNLLRQIFPKEIVGVGCMYCEETRLP